MKSFWKMLAVLMIATMLVTACAPAATEAPAPVEPAPAEPVAATEAPAPVAPEAPAEPAAPPAMVYPAGQELTDAFAGKYKGTVVTMQGPFTDADAVKFDNSVKSFRRCYRD